MNIAERLNQIDIEVDSLRRERDLLEFIRDQGITTEADAVEFFIKFSSKEHDNIKQKILESDGRKDNIFRIIQKVFPSITMDRIQKAKVLV